MIIFNNFQSIDAPDVEQTQFSDDMKIWLSNLVSILNSNFIISNSIASSFSNLIKAEGIDVGGGGASVIVPLVGLTASGYVTATLISSTNPNIVISSLIPSLNSFTVNFNSNPGASAIIVYQAFMVPPQ